MASSSRTPTWSTLFKRDHRDAAAVRDHPYRALAANLLVADSYGTGTRVFLAGDAVHLVIPTGGLGMNTGCGDAIDLSWKLAATLAGWGGPNLLRSYAIERRQVGERNVAASRFASQGRRKWRAMWRPNIRDDTPAGRRDPRRTRPRRRCRAAQDQRNARRRTRLSLCRFAADRGGAGEGPRPRIHGLCAEHLAGRAPAPCLAQGRHRGARTASATATATRCCGLPDRPTSRPSGHAFARAYGAPYACSIFPTNAPAIFMDTISFWYGRTSTWCGAATRLRRIRANSPRAPRATSRVA